MNEMSGWWKERPVLSKAAIILAGVSLFVLFGGVQLTLTEPDSVIGPRMLGVGAGLGALSGLAYALRLALYAQSKSK